MKKFIFAFALLLQTVFVFATDNTQQVMRATSDKVKMYRQPSTAAETLMDLKTTDKVVFIRKHNSQWSIVSVNDQVGYVQRGKIKADKGDEVAAKE
jgi:uncharacterized protein YgiM (DUF1202 family)